MAWPFSAPGAAEKLLVQALCDCSPVPAVRTLLGERAFAAWVRQRAHDALNAPGSADAELLDGVPRCDLEQIVRAPPDQRKNDEPYCARCGTVYVHTVTQCGDCERQLSQA